VRRAARAALVTAWGLVAITGVHAQGADGAVTLPFTRVNAGDPLPAGWSPYLLSKTKARTRYELVADGNAEVLQAVAESSASGLLRAVRVDPRATPVLAWRWRIEQVPAGADIRVAKREDAPARIVLTFDGDLTKLGLRERAKLLLARSLSGHDMPYATLVYVWSDDAPPGTVVANPHTGRIQMVVADNAEAGGRWSTLSRNVLEDYRRAFGEEPGAIVGVGVLTDSDNTGSQARASYADIGFRPAPAP
jgi:hypothetical protein